MDKAPPISDGDLMNIRNIPLAQDSHSQVTSLNKIHSRDGGVG